LGYYRVFHFARDQYYLHVSFIRHYITLIVIDLLYFHTPINSYFIFLYSIFHITFHLLVS
jgi:hypothetical protein